MLISCSSRALLYLFTIVGLSPNAVAQQVSSEPAESRQFKAAVEAQEHGDSGNAIRLYQEVLRTDPKALPARVNLGGLLVEASKLDEAIALYRQGLQLEPHSKDLHAGLGYAFGRRGTPSDVKLAIVELQPLYSTDPADEQVGMLLADAYVRDDRAADALPLLVPLEQHHPQDRDIAWLAGTALIRSGHLREGLQRVDAIASAGGDPDAYLLAGEARLDLQQFDTAKGDANEALKLDPDLPGGATLLGRALEHLGDYPAAELELRRAVSEDANDFEAQFYLGALLLFQRNLTEAEQHLRKALAINASSAETRYKVANLEESRGDRSSALQDLRVVVAERPSWLEPHSKLVALLYRTGRTEEAEREKAILDRLNATELPRTSEQALP